MSLSYKDRKNEIAGSTYEVNAEFILIWTEAIDNYENSLEANFYYLWQHSFR